MYTNKFLIQYDYENENNCYRIAAGRCRYAAGQSDVHLRNVPRRNGSSGLVRQVRRKPHDYPQRCLRVAQSSFFRLLLPVCHTFLCKDKTHVNKWLGGTAFALWCINLLRVVLDIVPSLYIAANFSGDEMYRPLEDYWETVGMSDYPLLWFLLSEGSMGGTLYFLQYYGYWICPLSYLGFAVAFALLVKKDKVLGITGATVMAISFLSYLLYQLPYVYIAYNLGWIALCAVVLGCLRRSSPDKPFVLS